MDWQPIETAPEDGTTVELLGANGKLDIGNTRGTDRRILDGVRGKPAYALETPGP